MGGRALKLFLCGGGAGSQVTAAYKRLSEVICRAKPCLYLPLAMEEEQYGGCYQWISRELAWLELPGIEMVRDAKEILEKNLLDYSFLFLGGGNTFRLWQKLKESGASERMKAYLAAGGIAFGGSGGAIIFGESLETCRLDDKNEVGIEDFTAFNFLHGVSLFCHYTNHGLEENKEREAYLLEFSQTHKVLALPEETTLFLQENQVEILGTKPCYYFERGRRIFLNRDFPFPLKF